MDNMANLSISELEALAGKHTVRQASEVKSNWRSIVKEAQKKEVIVTNYNRPEAVVMSADRYVELQKAAKANDPMERLKEQWWEELAVLRTPEGQERMMKAFSASPQEIADAINAAAKQKK